MAESLWRVRRGKGHQTVTAVCLSGTGPPWRWSRPQGPLGGGCPVPRWLAETAAAAGCDGGDASSLSHLWAAARYVSSGGGAPRLAAPPPGQKWRRCRWRHRWCWGSSAGGSPAWQSPDPEPLQRTGSKGRMSRRWRSEGDEGWRCEAEQQTVAQRGTDTPSEQRMDKKNKWSTVKHTGSFWVPCSKTSRFIIKKGNKQRSKRSLCAWKQTAHGSFLIKQHVRGAAPEKIGGRSRHRLPCLYQETRRRNSKFMMRVVASG